MFFILSVLLCSIFSLLFFWVDCNPYLYLYYIFRPNGNFLKKKVVWIVGASTGIGEEVAYQLAKKNCKLILTSTTKSKLEAVKENCLKVATDLKNDDVMVLAYDISDLKESENAFKQIVEKFGDIDVLINNAARISTGRILDDFDLEVHKKLFDVNYFANIKIAKIVTRHWISIKSKGLKIMAVTSSIGAYGDAPFYSAYTSTKKALQGFYKDLALQHYRDGISVCILAPGPTATALADKSIVEGETQTDFQNINQMTSERCAKLSLIAIANRHSESFICEQPWLLLTYISEKYSYELLYIYKKINMVKFSEKIFLKDLSK